LEELRHLNDQRKILLPDNMPPSPPQEPAKPADDAKTLDVDESPADSSDSTDEDAHSRRNLRRGNDRAAERLKKREEEQKRKEEAEAAAKVPKQSKQFTKVLKDIQKKEDLIKKCEEEIAVIDNDLREADCPRTRVLGKDRFWNRYYWFERNGMPYGGLPNSSTASAGYANGCIWVQGPDDLEREGYIDLVPEYQSEYRTKFDMTVPQRKQREEGSTSVFNARQWGFFSEPREVDDLLNWLDARGFNELKLRKEILSYKEKIVTNMENRKRYLNPEEDKKEPKRMSTRTRTQQTPEPPYHRCLAWQNTTALEELGHLHSEPPPPPRSRKQTKKREATEESPMAPAPKTRRR
jgi:Williams-Beuren syndrome DDT (WSD), D-TOX E motif